MRRKAAGKVTPPCQAQEANKKEGRDGGLGVEEAHRNSTVFAGGNGGRRREIVSSPGAVSLGFRGKKGGGS